VRPFDWGRLFIGDILVRAATVAQEKPIILARTAMTEPVLHARWEDVDFELVTEMVARKQVGAGQRVVQSYLKKGALIPRHAHAEAQWICVLNGALRLYVGGTEFTLKDGEVLRVSAAVSHQGEALDDTLVLDMTGGEVVFGAPSP
jgi:quercetin dioxygenase-like cupin family protein